MNLLRSKTAEFFQQYPGKTLLYNIFKLALRKSSALAKDRGKWKKSSAALCATEREEDRRGEEKLVVYCMAFQEQTVCVWYPRIISGKKVKAKISRPH